MGDSEDLEHVHVKSCKNEERKLSSQSQMEMENSVYQDQGNLDSQSLIEQNPGKDEEQEIHTLNDSDTVKEIVTERMCSNEEYSRTTTESVVNTSQESFSFQQNNSTQSLNSNGENMNH